MFSLFLIVSKLEPNSELEHVIQGHLYYTKLAFLVYPPGSVNYVVFNLYRYFNFAAIAPWLEVIK